MRRAMMAGLILAGTMIAATAQAATYKVDLGHTFIQWKIQHLGFSWMIGRFNQFEGTFDFDPATDAAAQQVSIKIDTSSLDSNHAKRDKHIRSSDFLDVEKHPSASFESTGFKGDESGGTLTGNLTLMGVTKELTLAVKKVGEGDDPWGNYRAGFSGTTKFDRRDFGIDKNLGPASWMVDLELHVEGIRE
jgi:polyisoprenoid-binding protein YceI